MRGRSGLVLAGGAAHGAYEVGVLRYISEVVASDVDVEPRFDVICGTSVGAVNACALAAQADRPAEATSRLADIWSRLRLPDVLQISPAGILGMVRSLAGGSAARRASLFADAPLRRMLEEVVPFERIATSIASGALSALTVSATHVATGRTVIFVDQAGPVLVSDMDPARAVMRAARIGPEHVLASAAVPLLFPAISLDGELHCDGGLRQMLPLAPAVHLGAEALVVINPRHLPADEPQAVRAARERAYGSPIFLLGRTLDVLLIDRVHDDLERLRQVNAIIDAGARRWGPGFAGELGRELRRPVRSISTVEIRSSVDLARLAADHVLSRGFVRRAGAIHGRLFRCLAEAEGTRETTVLSYLLFDGAFACELMALGFEDARRQHEELCAVLGARRRGDERTAP